MKRVVIFVALTIALFFPSISRADETIEPVLEGSGGAAVGSAFGLVTTGGYATLDFGFRRDSLLIYADGTFESTRTNDGIPLHVVSAGPALLVQLSRFRVGGGATLAYSWFDRVSENAAGSYGAGVFVQGGVDLFHAGAFAMAFDLRGGFVLMPTTTYPSLHAGISVRF